MKMEKYINRRGFKKKNRKIDNTSIQNLNLLMFEAVSGVSSGWHERSWKFNHLRGMPPSPGLPLPLKITPDCPLYYHTFKRTIFFMIFNCSINLLFAHYVDILTEFNTLYTKYTLWLQKSYKALHRFLLLYKYLSFVYIWYRYILDF